MIDIDLDRLLKQSQNYLESISSDLEPQITALLYRYICVVVSANVDKSIHLILAEYARCHGSDELKRYVSKRYQRGTNYNAQRIIETLSLFHPQWGEDFRAAIETANLKDQIDSIYGIRNAISHGEPYNITRPSINGYFDAHKNVIELIRKVVLG